MPFLPSFLNDTNIPSTVFSVGTARLLTYYTDRDAIFLKASAWFQTFYYGFCNTMCLVTIFIWSRHNNFVRVKRWENENRKVLMTMNATFELGIGLLGQNFPFFLERGSLSEISAD